MIQPMLLQTTPRAFDQDGWVWQLKWDGIRCIGIKVDGTWRLFSRHAKEMTLQYPEVVAGLTAAVEADDVILDGELVSLLPDGRPDFHKVMGRHAMVDAHRIRMAASQTPGTFMVFDVLQAGGHSLTALTLRDRQAWQEKIVRPNDHVRLVESWPGMLGTAYASAVAQHGLEGMVAKCLDSTYRPGHRTHDWLKLKFWETAEVTLLAVRRHPFAALAGKPDGAPIAWVELGWGPDDRKVIFALLGQLQSHEEKGVVWLHPYLQCRIRHRINPDGTVREPVFDGFIVAAPAA